MDKTSATLKGSKFTSVSLRKSSGKSLVNKMYVKRKGLFTRHCSLKEKDHGDERSLERIA